MSQLFNCFIEYVYETTYTIVYKSSFAHGVICYACEWWQWKYYDSHGVLVIYLRSNRKFVFQGGARGRKQKYDSASGTECAGRGAGSCTPATPCGIECICMYVCIYGVAWRTAVRPAATAFQRLPKPKPISCIPISLLSSLFTRVLALFPCCPTLYPLHSGHSVHPHHRASYSNPYRDPLRRRNAALHCLPLWLPLPSFHLSLSVSVPPYNITTTLAMISQRISRSIRSIVCRLAMEKYRLS